MIKKFLTLAIVATTFVLASCGGAATSENTVVDSMKVEEIVVDTTTMVTPVDTAAMKMDTIAVTK